MRLADAILTERLQVCADAESQKLLAFLRRDLLSATRIVADNVQRYLEAAVDGPATANDPWDASTYPNVAPPFEVCWVEARIGRFFAPVSEFGALVYAQPLGPDGWWMHMIPVQREYGKIVSVPALVKYRVASDGGLLPVEPGSENNLVVEWSQCVPGYEEWAHLLSYLTRSILFSFTLMHCKNVELEEILPPAPLSRKFERRTGRPLVRYNVIQIEPATRIISAAREEAGGSMGKALHICRGHFKDYRQRGLFGRTKGLFWWDQHLRGSADRGVVVSDYLVKEPAA